MTTGLKINDVQIALENRRSAYTVADYDLVFADAFDWLAEREP